MPGLFFVSGILYVPQATTDAEQGRRMIALKEITAENVWDIVALQVEDTQRDLVATNAESLIDAYTTITAGGVALPFGIYAEAIPVGFLMIGYEEMPGEPNAGTTQQSYHIWRFMIDKTHQGKGYAKAALQQALAYIKTFPAGPAEVCWLSYEPDNRAAAALYQSFGFKETGAYEDDEIIACLVIGGNSKK